MAQLACKQVLLVDLQAVWGTIEWIYVFFRANQAAAKQQ